ncbi:MAG: hypothetical protein EBR52_08320 [Microbacteriaceae bacterium]|nr:hypothetical protein [Microbacteriaceae bacterium]
MQAPGYLDLDCWQGANFDYQLTWTVAGSAVNVTGYSARMQVRQYAESTATVLSLVNGTGITLGGTAGTIALSAVATATSAIEAGQYVYDLELVSGAGYVTRLVEGSFVVYAEVTR